MDEEKGGWVMKLLEYSMDLDGVKSNHGRCRYESACVLFAFLEGGGEGRDTQTHTSHGHGCEVLVVGIQYLPWVHGRHAHPLPPLPVLANDW